MNTSQTLTISSLACGGIGAILFVIYKLTSSKKNTILGHSSKFLIAIGIFLLAIAVLLLSEDKP